MIVKEIMTSKYDFVDIDIMLNDAIKKFDDETDVLFVYEKDRYKGIITEKRILESGIKFDAKVRRLVVPSPKVDENESVLEAIRLMIENDVMELPVISGSEQKHGKEDIVGAITSENIFRTLLDEKKGRELLASKELLKAGSIMSPGPIVVSPKDTIYSIINLFKMNNISRVPVVDDGDLVGILSLHDVVRKAIEIDKSPDIFAKTDDVFKTIEAYTLMNPTVQTARKDDTIEDVIEKVMEDGSVVVVDIDNKPIGMITKYDILERILEANRKTDEINIQLSSKVDVDRDYVMKEISSFCNRHGITHGSIYVYITKVSNYLYQCRIRANTNAVKVNLHSEAKDIRPLIKEILSKLKQKISGK